MPGTMLILRGITNLKVWPKYPNGALDEPPALEYASKRGYVGRVLDVSGETGDRSPQTQRALHEFLSDSTITALYGFSGGGYNVYHILNRLKAEQRGLLELVVVIGVESNKLSAHALNSNRYNAHWELVYRNDPPRPLTHIDGPRALLAELP
jgi:hypothetical protein